MWQYARKINAVMRPGVFFSELPRGIGVKLVFFFTKIKPKHVHTEQKTLRRGYPAQFESNGALHTSVAFQIYIYIYIYIGFNPKHPI